MIREECCPKEALKQIRTDTEVVNLSSASTNRLHVLGIVSLTVTIASQSRVVPFTVVRDLGAYILLGTTFTDRHVQVIFPRKRLLVMSNGERVPIIKKLTLIPERTELSEPKSCRQEQLARSNFSDSAASLQKNERVDRAIPAHMPPTQNKPTARGSPACVLLPNGYNVSKNASTEMD